MNKHLTALLISFVLATAARAAYPDISTWTTPYKGVLVANGLGIDNDQMWYDRDDSGQVHAIDLAEEVAAVQDCLGEVVAVNNAYSDSNPQYCCLNSEWLIDNTVTQNWGGYSNFVLTGTGVYDGTYTFAGRTYDSYGSWVGGAIDVYVSSGAWGGTYILIDCGPGGAEDGTSYWWGSIPPAGWVFGAAFNEFYDFAYSPVWSNAASTTFNYYPPWMGNPFGAAITSPTYPTGGVSRVRKYFPHALMTYTNYISTVADQAAIQGIRSQVAMLKSLDNTGTSVYYVGPVDEGENYDGMTNFPLVSTSAWAQTYYTWTTNGWTDSHYYTNKTLTAFDNWNEYPPWDGQWLQDTNGDWYQDPPDTGVWVEVTGVLTNITYPTTTYWNASESIFVSTNELSWHYSALRRLRDTYYPSHYQTNRSFFAQCSGGTLHDAYQGTVNAWTCTQGFFTAYFPAWAMPSPAAGASISASSSAHWDATYGMVTSYSVTVSLCAATFRTGGAGQDGGNYYGPQFPLYTNIDKTVEWYAHVSGPANFCAYGTPVTVTNVWKLVDTQDSCGTQSTTSAYAAWPTFPPESDAVVGQTKGFTLDGIVPIVRWHQRACSDDVFEDRYTTP